MGFVFSASDAAVSNTRDERFGMYVHIPFCARRCAYCAFVTTADHSPDRIETYVDALISEIRRFRVTTQRCVTSVFLGGGTPTLLTATQLGRILRAIDLPSSGEVTVESNPESLNASWLRAARDEGVNRLSIGVQSLDDVVLGELGRLHDAARALWAIDVARRAGIARVSVDLIYGSPSESIESWRQTIEGICALVPTISHVSAYALTIEENTALSRLGIAAGSEDVLAEKYSIVDEALGEVGLNNYEISNWAMPGEACEHNRLYWDQGDYIGIGVGAHSHVGGHRWWNIADVGQYVLRIAEGKSALDGEEWLDNDERAREALELALRTDVGIPPSALAPADYAVLAHLFREEKSREGRLVLNREGRLLADEVAIRLRTAKT